MKPSIEKIYKFFKLEIDRGFDNRAVVGGLERMLDTWEPEARADNLPEDLIQAISTRLRDYHRLSENSRFETLEGLWNRVQRTTGATDLLQPAPSESRPRVPPPLTVPAPGLDKSELTATLESELENKRERSPRQPTPSSYNDKTDQALDAPVTVLPNVGARNAQTLSRLGIITLRDMLYDFPRRYDDYTKLTPINRLTFGELVTVIGTVKSVSIRKIKSKNSEPQLVEMVVSDGTAGMRVTWFNQPWIARRLHAGVQVALSGKVDQYLGRIVMNNPELETLEQEQLNTNRIVPVYALTSRITQRWLRKMMHQVVSYWAPRIQDYFPEELRSSADLVSLSQALLQVHFPDSWEDLEVARHRLAFDEIFLLQLGVLSQKHAWQSRTGCVFETEDEWLDSQLQRLPFPLTGAQQQALQDIRTDLASGRPMNRLLQGDVGSGKTVIAGLAIALVTHHGSQAALMAPTGILAEQHYTSMLALLSESGSILNPQEVRLLVGATPDAEKEQIRVGLADGSIKLVIGTHALIEDPIAFADLELTIVDEQHRFGVDQRAALRSKGTTPHLLVMTATPIPRSLALTVYGDLDLSVMDEMPPGRQEVGTFVLAPRERERAFRLIRSQVEAGHQAFIIYPLVEESEKSEMAAAVEEHARLQAEIFPYLSLGLLHGRLRAEEKDDVMTRFRNGEFHILVSTSVVEVGVDIPNATVMLIEGANRFGLSQLHQFRGRVGRGAEKSYCLLIPESSDQVENERLQVMVQTNDGFVLAQHDLEQRGPGEFLGTRQSGYSELRLASLTNLPLIEKARHHAQILYEHDPALELPEHQPLASTLSRFWGGEKGDIS